MFVMMCVTDTILGFCFMTKGLLIRGLVIIM